MSKGWKYGVGLGIVIVLLFVANLLIGSVTIPVSDVFRILMGNEGEKASWSFIVWESRLPQALTALLCGSGAFIGSMVVMGLILFFSTLLKSNVMLLITGIMIGYIASSAIALLNFFATAEGVQSYMIWGLGNFGGVSLQQMPAFALVTVTGLFGSLLLIKPLNALLLGERYAENLGVNIGHVRNWLLVITGLLTAITTAFCGPVAFIGLAVPHIARMILRTANHNSLLPVTILSGGAVALLCNLICVLPGEAGIIPLNAVTPIIGASVIIYVIIISQRTPQHFN